VYNYIKFRVYCFFWKFKYNCSEYRWIEHSNEGQWGGVYANGVIRRFPEKLVASPKIERELEAHYQLPTN